MPKPEPKAGKCTCNPGWGVLSWILFALGLWALAAGFGTQFKAPMSADATVLGLYFVGFLLFGIGKMVKWKAHGRCPVHANVN